MNASEAKQIVLRVLREVNCWDLSNLFQEFCKRAGEDNTHTQYESNWKLASEAVWDLITERVLSVGYNSDSPNYPSFHITEYGKQILKEEHFIPHDPEGYLQLLIKRVPSIDEITKIYVTESLQAYLHQLPLSSAVMLGAASEQIFLVVSDALALAIKSQKEQENYNKAIKNKPIGQHFEVFKNRLFPLRKKLPDEIEHNLDKDWNGIFNLIRNTRNDAGHPSRPNITMDDALSNLLIFPSYCTRACALIDFLIANISSLE
jgi:hypothetical protein